VERRYQAKLREWEEQRDKILQMKREELERIQKAALERAEMARKDIEMAKHDLLTTYGEHQTRSEQIMEAKIEIQKIQEDLVNIGNKDISLKKIEEVLDRSINALRLLQQSVQQLVGFFNKIGDTVRQAQEQHLSGFLETINDAIEASGGSTDALHFKDIEFFASQQEVIGNITSISALSLTSNRRSWILLCMCRATTSSLVGSVLFTSASHASSSHQGSTWSMG
jgi:hypothetical protein